MIEHVVSHIIDSEYIGLKFICKCKWIKHITIMYRYNDSEERIQFHSVYNNLKL